VRLPSFALTPGLAIAAGADKTANAIRMKRYNLKVMLECICILPPSENFVFNEGSEFSLQSYCGNSLFNQNWITL
jgi:hypothetical protein